MKTNYVECTASLRLLEVSRGNVTSSLQNKCAVISDDEEKDAHIKNDGLLVTELAIPHHSDWLGCYDCRQTVFYFLLVSSIIHASSISSLRLLRSPFRAGCTDTTIALRRLQAARRKEEEAGGLRPMTWGWNLAED